MPAAPCCSLLPPTSSHSANQSWSRVGPCFRPACRTYLAYWPTLQYCTVSARPGQGGNIRTKLTAHNSNGREDKVSGFRLGKITNKTHGQILEITSTHSHKLMRYFACSVPRPVPLLCCCFIGKFYRLIMKFFCAIILRENGLAANNNLRKFSNIGKCWNSDLCFRL